MPELSRVNEYQLKNDVDEFPTVCKPIFSIQNMQHIRIFSIPMPVSNSCCVHMNLPDFMS